MHDPTLGNAHIKEVNAKSIEVLLSLLKDDDPKVRIAGCDASIRILGVFWDALCSANIRSLLNEIVMNHLKDASSSMVRYQAVRGITLLLDSKSSHGVLRPLLPLVGNCIHDSVERVRLEAAKMLLKLKGMKGFKYYHVVPSNHILARLAAEGADPQKICGPVASAIVELLVNSYFPKGEMGSEQTRRTIHFISHNRAASRVFYANLEQHLEINFCCKLIVMLFKTMKKAVEDEEKGIDISHSCIRVMASNTDLMSGVAETINILYESIFEDLLLEGNNECLQFVQSVMKTEEVLYICNFFEQQMPFDQEPQKSCNHMCSSLLHCVTFSSDQNFPMICKAIESRSKCNPGIDLLPYYAILCSWGKCDDVVLSWTVILRSILNAVGNKDKDEKLSASFNSTKRIRKRKQSCMQQNDKEGVIIPLVSHKSVLIMIQRLFSNEKKTLYLSVRDSILSSENACAELERLLESVHSTMQKLFVREDVSISIWLCDFILN